MKARVLLQQWRTLALLCALSPGARAQTPKENPDPQVENEAEGSAINDGGETIHEIKAPLAISTPVPPIEGTWDKTEVMLLLLINKEGRVERADVISGDDPFAQAALDSTKNWSFEPASREGEPAPARIHFLLTFEPRAKPKPDPSVNQGPKTGPDAPEQEPLTPASEASGAAVEEVVVLGKLPDPGSTSLTRAEVRNLAGAFDDPLRSIEVMPGVSPIISGLPLFFIRGAPPGNVGYFIDGIRVPLLYHGLLGPSVIHPAFIEQVTLSGGPYPTKFGRYAGATVEAELAEPEGRFRAETSVRLLDAGAFVEAPIADGKGYAMLGGRYSYTGLLVTLFSPGVRAEYWDYQALAGYSLTRNDEVSIMTLGAFDYAGTDGEVLVGTEFHRIDLRYTHRFDKDTEARLAFTLGKDRTRSAEGFLSDRVLGSRLNVEHRAPTVVVRSGADVWVDDYNMEVAAAISEPETYFELFPARTDVTAGVWTDFVLFPQGRIQIIPGIRADLFSSLGQQRYSVDPRIFASYQLTPRVRATHGLGVAHQSPNFVPSVPGAQVAGVEGGLQKSLQASTEYEALLPWKMTGSVAFFLNMTENMTDPVGLGQSFAFDETSADTRALGRAAGVEFYLKRPLTKRLGALFSYTFSKALRSYNTISTVPGYDRPHVFNGALSYEFGWNIRASAKASIASGIPGRRTSPNIDGYYFDQSRSSPYARLDLKLEKRWYVSEKFFWGLSLEVLNATHSPSVSKRTCGVEGCVNEGTLPITFPNLGVEAVWQ